MPKSVRPMDDEPVQFFEAALVEKKLQALSRRQLARLVLAVDSFRPPPASAAASRRLNSASLSSMFMILKAFVA